MSPSLQFVEKNVHSQPYFIIFSTKVKETTLKQLCGFLIIHLKCDKPEYWLKIYVWLSRPDHRLRQRLYLTGHMGESKLHMHTSDLVHSQHTGSQAELHSRPRGLLCICTYTHPLPSALPACAGPACRPYIYLHHQASHFNS